MTPLTAAEVAELLGRAPRARLGAVERRALAGRRVLITGAAGSIGSALAREIASCGPAVLGLVDQSELGLFTLERELGAGQAGPALRPFLADVSRGPAMTAAMQRVRPHVVYHAAAYKHVTMAERAIAASALVNVVGTAVVARAAASAGARFVLISSDKAADPRSVMGATKRLAERVTLALATPKFRPIVVRFGNVLGSSGSVLPILRECIRAGRPIPITDPDATRYFMTDAEAVALVVGADLIGHTPETYWLDMGEPVRLGDLVERLLRIEARAGFPAVPIEIVGLRAGEKRDECLNDGQLTFERTVDRRIRVARDVRSAGAGPLGLLPALRHAALRSDDRRVLEVLIEAVPGFQPSEAARAGALDMGRHAARERRSRARRPAA